MTKEEAYQAMIDRNIIISSDDSLHVAPSIKWGLVDIFERTHHPEFPKYYYRVSDPITFREFWNNYVESGLYTFKKQ